MCTYKVSNKFSWDATPEHPLPGKGNPLPRPLPHNLPPRIPGSNTIDHLTDFLTTRTLI